MLESFFESWKKEYTEVTQGMIIKLEQKYEELWKRLTEDLQLRKLTLESEVNKINKEKESKGKELIAISDKLISLSEAVKKESSVLASIEEKQKLVIGKICEEEKKLIEIGDRETKLENREKENAKKEIELKAKLISINEKQASLKKIFNNM